MKKFLEEFKAFAMQGNVLDMAIGVVIGGAFSAIVTSLVNDIIMPIVGFLTGGLDFTGFVLTLNAGTGLTLKIGNFIQAIVNFVIIALCIFVAIKSISKMHKPKKEEPSSVNEELETLKEIRDLIKASHNGDRTRRNHP